jgi:hypothetical protein
MIYAPKVATGLSPGLIPGLIPGLNGAKLRAVWAKCRACEVGEASSPHFLSVSVLCPAGAIGLQPRVSTQG